MPNWTVSELLARVFFLFRQSIGDEVTVTLGRLDSKFDSRLLTFSMRVSVRSVRSYVF